MLCPKCHDQVLVVLERSGLEIEYCGGCRGVWLDKGELEKLIALEGNQPVRQERPRQNREDWDDDDRRERKRGGFLRDLFDFD